MRLSAPWRRASALALLVTLGLLAHLVVISPTWQSYQTTRHTVAEHESRIGRLLAVAAESQELSERRNAFRAEADLRRYLIAGESVTMAAVALQKRIESIAAQTGGRLISTEVLTPEDEHGFVRVTIRARLALDILALQQVLYELEGRPPLLVIDEIVVIARGGRSVGAAGGTPANLDVQLRVFGWTPTNGKDT